MGRHKDGDKFDWVIESRSHYRGFVQQQQGYSIDWLLTFLEAASPTHAAKDTNSSGAWSRPVMFHPAQANIRAVQQRVRQFIDEWVDSGFHSDGSEWVYERNFDPRSSSVESEIEDVEPRDSPFPAAMKALARYFQGALYLREDREGDSTYLVAGVANTRESGVAISIGFRGGIDFQPSESIRADVDVRAAGIFLGFYCSEWIYRLMRCATCGLLAAPARKPKKAPFASGWRCKSCARKAPALISTAKTRKAERDRWMAAVSDAIITYETKSRKPIGDRIIWILGQVQDRVRGMKRNRISRLCSFYDIHKKSGISPQEAIEAAIATYQTKSARKR